MEGGCLAGGNVRFPPSEQATRRALGNLDSLACMAVQGAALASLADNGCQACMAVQEHPGKISKPKAKRYQMLTSGISCMLDASGSDAAAGGMAHTTPS